MLNKNGSYGKYKKMWALISSVMVFALLLSGCGTAQKSKVYHVGILSGLGFVADTTDGFKVRNG